MKIAAFKYKNRIGHGLLNNQIVEVIDSHKLPAVVKTNVSLSLSKVKLLPPVSPSKIIAVGLNYLNHARELKMPVPQEPIIFLKPPSAVIGHDDEILLPQQSNQVDFEAELAIIIGKQAHEIKTQKAAEYIFGYCCANDVTARDLQKKDGQWTRAKSFDTFCPLGPWVETEVEPDNLSIKLRVNGEEKQNSNTKDMIFNCYELVSYISHIMTLYPQDIILTGTPPGVGSLHSGDMVEVEIEKVGLLRNKVV